MKIEHTLNTITSFTLKAIVITVCIGFLIPSLIPDFNWVKTMQGKLIIASFIQNPTVLWKLAEQQEAERKYKDAANLLDIAVGLLEMNCSSAQALSRYQNKREYLISLAEKNQ